MRRMRIASSSRSPWHALLAVTVVVAALTAWTATARAAGEIVTVAPLGGGGPSEVPLDDVEPEESFIDTTYPVYSSSGKDAETVRHGILLRDILNHAGVDGYRFVKVRRPDGGSVTLSVSTLNASPLAPVVYVDDAGAMRFLRQSTGPSDYNGDDWLTFEDGRMATALVSAGRLKATLSASTENPKVGQRVTFRVEVDGTRADVDYRYEWLFDSGQDDQARPTTSKPSITWTFDENNAFYTASVNVVGGGEHAGADVSIEVGDASFEPPPGGDGGGEPEQAAPPPVDNTAPTPAPAPADTPIGTTYDDGTFDYDFQQDPTTGTGLTVDDGTVEGYLLADASSPPSSATLDAIEAAREGFEDEEEDDGSPIPTAVWALLGTLMLVTAGAGLESRPTRPRDAVARVARMRGGALRNLLPRKRS